MASWNTRVRIYRMLHGMRTNLFISDMHGDSDLFVDNRHVGQETDNKHELYRNVGLKRNPGARGGPIPWLPRSTDLHPVDFFIWDYMKNLVYDTLVESAMDLVARIFVPSGIIANRPGLLANVRQSLHRHLHCEMCITAAGRNFKHLH